MAKITPGQHKSSGAIPEPAARKADDSLSFSFKHLDLHTNPKFALSRCASGYLPKFIERLKALHGFTVSELKNTKSKSLRAHTLDWNDTSEPDGFRCLNEQLRGIPAWQFEVSSNAHGRFHGFFIDRTFFIVWIDPEHLLYR